MKTSFIYQTLLLLLLSAATFAQSIEINPGSSSSSIFTGTATDKGILVPRMTDTERAAIPLPAVGLLVYQTNATAGFYYYNGTAWTILGGTSSELQKITEGTNTGWRLLGSNPLHFGNIGADAVDLSLPGGASGTRGATGINSFASGYQTTASGIVSSAFGANTIASGDRSASFGNGTTASGESSLALNHFTTASGQYATSLGLNTTASGRSSGALGEFATASGQSSVALNTGTTAKSYSETVVGTYNTDYTPAGSTNYNSADRAFGVGIGAWNGGRKDGLIVYKDGTLAFDKLTTAPATATDRFYILNNKIHYNGAEVGGASELQKITEGANTGWRILGRNAANFGDIGSGAVDLSTSDSPSATKGATGIQSTAIGLSATASGAYSTALGNTITASAHSAVAIGSHTLASGIGSTAMGNGTIASGGNSTAMGQVTTASGDNSTSMGTITTASGNASTAMGVITSAKSYGETSVGTYNTSYTPANALAYDAADRAFGVGIGNSNGSTKDGFIVYKTGNTFISNEGNTPLNGAASIIPGFGVGALQVRSSGDGLNLRTGTGNNSMNIAKAGTPSNGNTYMAFGHLGTGSFSEIGSIKASSGTGISFNTSSDRRLKTDNGTYRKGLSTLNQIKIHDYTWKENKSRDIGVFAQELYAIYPGAVTKGDDKAENDPTKIEKRWQVDYSKLVPVLVSAVQELSEKNEALEQKIVSIEKQKAVMTAQLKEMTALKNDIEAIKAQLSMGAVGVSGK